MRSVKSSGGLTRGRGLSENQRSQWLLSMPACAEVTNAINEFTGVAYTTSEQHKEAENSRMERDKKDIVSMLRFLKDRDPFGELPSLRNIETGVTADSKVNLDSAIEVGEKIIESMSGQSISTYSFKRSQQVVTLNSKNLKKIDEEPIFVDTQLLFKRFATVANSMDLDLSEVLTFELCSIPTALFDANCLPREAHKSNLADYIWNLGNCHPDNISTSIQYVPDGGALLHRIPWLKGEKFGDI